MVYAGRDPVTGKERRLTATAHTRARGRADPHPAARPGRRQHRPATGATVGYLLDRWLDTADLELSTRHAYQSYIERTLRPRLGHVPLRKLTVDGLDAFYVELRRHGSRCRRCALLAREGKAALRAGERYTPGPGAAEVVHEPDCARGLPMAPATVRKIHFILSAALGLAVRWLAARQPRRDRQAAPPPAPRGRPAQPRAGLRADQRRLGRPARTSARCCGWRW